MTLHEAEHAPGKEKEDVDLVIAHWVMFAPGLSGMYETIKELVLAEMQLPGVEAGIVEPENKEGGKSDGWITTQSHGWAQERATIHVSSYFMTGYSTMQRPRVMLIHGTPEACYEAERESGSYTAVIGSLQNLDASVVMNKRQFSMWKPYDHRGILHCIEKGIDLSRYTPKGMRIDLNGEPAVGMGEVERKGGVKLPLLPYAAVNEYYQKNPLVRLHHWGVTQERPVLDILFHKTLFDKWLGKYRLMGLQLYPDQWYRGCDMLLSPSLYGDPSRVHFEAMACGCPVIDLDSSLRWGDSHATMHARALDSINMAECIAKLYDQVRVDKAKVRKEARETAEKYYDIKRTAAQLVRILRRVQDEVGAK
jgi:glycosyltransferase involved in cell wall biosynthesis